MKSLNYNTGILVFMKTYLIAHDIRSAHNVGAFFRTCDGLGVNEILFSGYTPYPTFDNDQRLPHFADKLTRQIHKTALGAETTVNFQCFQTLDSVIKHLRENDTILVALEQHPKSLSLRECTAVLKNTYAKSDVALLLGNEIHGVDDATLEQVDLITEIPMHGTKESLNVSIAAGIALYELTSF